MSEVVCLACRKPLQDWYSTDACDHKITEHVVRLARTVDAIKLNCGAVIHIGEIRSAMEDANFAHLDIVVMDSGQQYRYILE